MVVHAEGVQGPRWYQVHEVLELIEEAGEECICLGACEVGCADSRELPLDICLSGSKAEVVPDDVQEQLVV